MALSGKIIGYVEISKTGDVFHNLLRHNPDELVAIAPDRVHDCEMHEGEKGAVGSVFSWQYTHGKEESSEKDNRRSERGKHKIVYKIVGGDLVDELYKSFRVIFRIEKKGDKQVAAWTFEFERPNISVPYPTSLMDYICDLTKDLDAHNTTKDMDANNITK